MGVLTVAQWVKDVVLLQLWSRLQLQLGFDPWPGNFISCRCSHKKKEEGSRREE